MLRKKKSDRQKKRLQWKVLQQKQVLKYILKFIYRNQQFY